MHARDREGVKFCQKSGATMEVECPNCKAKVHPGLKFCGEYDQAHLNYSPVRWRVPFRFFQQSGSIQTGLL